MKISRLQVTLTPDCYIGPDAVMLEVRTIIGNREHVSRQVLPSDDLTSRFDRELQFAGDAIKELLKTEGATVT